MKDKLHAALKALGVETLTCDYSGYGDSGSLDTPQAIPSISLKAQFDISPYWKERQVARSLEDAIRDYFYELLEGKHGGWENGDGAQGDFTWNIATNVITLNHGETYSVTEYTDYAF